MVMKKPDGKKCGVDIIEAFEDGFPWTTNIDTENGQMFKAGVTNFGYPAVS